MNYRQRQIEGNYDEYMARNAHNAAKWRENNPEKVAENNEKVIVECQFNKSDHDHDGKLISYSSTSSEYKYNV